MTDKDINDAILKARALKDRNIANRAYVKLHHDKLANIRKTLGFDQQYMAMLANSNRQYIVWVEKGQTKGISPEALQRILQIYSELEKTHARTHESSSKNSPPIVD